MNVHPGPGYLERNRVIVRIPEAQNLGNFRCERASSTISLLFPLDEGVLRLKPSSGGSSSTDILLCGVRWDDCGEQRNVVCEAQNREWTRCQITEDPGIACAVGVSVEVRDREQAGYSATVILARQGSVDPESE